MLSAGTDSVPAFNAYLQGLAANVSTISTGDAYSFLRARDGYERAIELDPEFALAHWGLARFWHTQMASTNMVSGIVEVPLEEMTMQFENAIEKAIAFEKDPVNRTHYRALQARQQLRYPQALRLNTDYLEQRPNDQRAQDFQIDLLVDMSRDDELIATIKTFQQRDGHDIIVTNSSLTYLLVSDDYPMLRDFAQESLRRVGDSAFVQYQAHRALLWVGDIDGASQLLPLLASSDLPHESRQLVALRQACAENNLADARRIYAYLKKNYAQDRSIMWVSHKIMGQHDKALRTLMELDETGDLRPLADYLSYAYFDARPFPNLMALLELQGIEPRVAKDIPYRCKS